MLSREETLHADAVIICCGGMAGAKLGGTQSGYDLLKSQGHTITKLFPALVQVKTDTTFVKALKGVRADGSVLVERNGKTLRKMQAKSSLRTSASAARLFLKSPVSFPQERHR